MVVFTWRIKNYSSCYKVKGEVIKSPLFTIADIPGGQWNLSFYPRGHSSLKNDENFVSCFLEWKSFEDDFKSFTVSHSIEIVDEKGKALEPEKIENRIFNKQKSSWGFVTFFPIGRLEKEMSSWNKDVLTIRCRIMSANGKLSELVACTTINVDRCSVLWRGIEASLFKYSESLAFRVSNLYNFGITLNSTRETIAILVHFANKESESPQQITFKFCLFDKMGCNVGSKWAMHVYENEETWKFPDFITKEMLGRCKVDSSQYQFKLKCDVCVSKKTHSSTIERLEFVSPSRRAWDDLMADFRLRCRSRLRNNPSLK